ncbi:MULTISPECIES: hypothetical protein [unclassified Saccharibacter]|uniref:hypothetical protein n=1 Tax=unclassified Saccharibacter TaxID=2648722 RepID=UPI001320EF34|nr:MULTISPECIES: hypothetical protein [unclassified Saccharibacter]MXV36804.1 hypothetical protein [Saccharibacter sp. EH611]MXV58706.1 hypothetical protein [Saccharibacter sp. EH70]MXV66212.1 hypothetical protein [Saccharibacter sp. EH60]
MRTDLIAPAHAYQQFSDDANIVAFFKAYNQLAQESLSWMVTHPMALYIGPALEGNLLTYCAFCLYGQFRYRISYTEIRSISGEIDGADIDRLTIDDTAIDKHYDGSAISDDLFKRILTWNFYKGDGLNFSIPWLKRRIMRFLTGENGHAWRFNSTHPVSVRCVGKRVIITLDRADWPDELTALLGRILTNGILNVPPMRTFTLSLHPVPRNTDFGGDIL